MPGVWRIAIPFFNSSARTPRIVSHETENLAVRSAPTNKPELIIHAGNLPATAEALRDVFAASGKFFDRGMPVRVMRNEHEGAPSAMPLTKSRVIIEAHHLCQPVKLDGDGQYIPATLPDRVAQMYLDMIGEWHLQPLAGFSTSPLLSDDGAVRIADGYDSVTRLWCCSIPKLELLSRPSRADANFALAQLRRAFRTFPFADAPRTRDADLGVEVVDIEKPAGFDESAFLVTLTRVRFWSLY